jgi:hypothetical protein
MPFTQHDDAATRRRIGSDLDAIVRAVRAEDPAVKALVLTGSFSRGEGGFAGGAPQNDYDLVAVRGAAALGNPYPRLRSSLEQELGVHIDLAPIRTWRLRHVRRTIFWYEVALRGRTLHGTDVLAQIPIRDAADLEPDEALRLLSNRAAGLLFAAESGARADLLLQSSKALLAAADVELLAQGVFAPSQTERQTLRRQRGRPSASLFSPDLEEWFDWAFELKVDPAHAPPRGGRAAWHVARRAVLLALPAALRRAGLASLGQAARRDRAADQVLFMTRAWHVGARPWVGHATARVRVASLAMLEAARGPKRPAPRLPRRYLRGLASPAVPPVAALASLRAVTSQ